MSVSPASTELRRSERFQASGATAKIVLRRHGIVTPPEPVRIHDFSAGGVGLTCRTKLVPGDEFMMMPGSDITQSKRFLYSVKHSRPIEGGFMVGAAFVRIVQDASAPRRM